MGLWDWIKDKFTKAYSYVTSSYHLAPARSGYGITIVETKNPNNSISLDAGMNRIDVSRDVGGNVLSTGYNFATTDISGKLVTPDGDTYATNFSLPKEYLTFRESILSGPMSGLSSKQSFLFGQDRARVKVNYNDYGLETILDDRKRSPPTMIPYNEASVYSAPKAVVRTPKMLVPSNLHTLYAKTPLGRAAYARPPPDMRAYLAVA